MARVVHSRNDVDPVTDEDGKAQHFISVWAVRAIIAHEITTDALVDPHCGGLGQQTILAIGQAPDISVMLFATEFSQPLYGEF